YERTQSNATLSRVYGGQYFFNTLDDFLAARAAEFNGDIPTSDNVRGWRQNLLGFYFQDDFQPRSYLTLNLGLRYEFTTVPTEAHGKLANIRNPLTDKAPTLGEPWYQGSYKDFGPRIGFSWDPWSNGRTAIRGGFGMYFDHLVAAPLNRAMSRIPPYSVTSRVLGAAAAFPRLDSSLLTSPLLTDVVSYGLQYPTSSTYAKNTSNADGVFGRYLDISGTVPQDPDDWRADWGPAGIDIRNYFSFNYTYDLPFARNMTGAAGKVLAGWQINGILTLTSGTPVTIYTGFNRSRNGASGTQITDRPDLLPGFNNNPVNGVSKGCPGVAPGTKLGTPDMYFDPCAFALPEPGTYGNLGRNTVIGPGL